ncbi:uncharacterized protein LOC105683690 [Athalia rosae]|uniref:uncharacterized protein LOC105683690 n=1 Tax=Athalia rosae TaxID=37344 RepID=UPI0020343C68|nr:uncharacterized protein LOC105683690 [Athalia rosae]
MRSTVPFKYAVCVLFVCGCVTSLIVPEELPTILSLIYSNIPPIKKGTDSRLGVGFRLGEHADFQILVELGPQRETQPIGNTDSKRRRQATLESAMKGDFGPWAQSVAKYQMQLRIQKEIEEEKRLQDKLKKLQAQDNQSEGIASGGSDWLKKWSKGMVEPPDRQPVEENLPIQTILPRLDASRLSVSRLSSGSNAMTEEKAAELQKLYKDQPASTQKV